MIQKVSELNNDRSLQDKAYDLLGEMLVERDTARYMLELEEDLAHGNTAEMDAFFAEQDQANLKKIETYTRKQRSKRLFLHTLPRVGQVAAIFITVIFLAGSVAVATSHTVRVHVMQLLLNIEKEYTELRLVEDEDASFDVPAEWQGSSFPAYIPEGMTIFELLDGHSITYHDGIEGTQEISFSEVDASSVINIDTENSVMRMIDIRGNDGYIAITSDAIHIFWSDGIHYYVVITRDIDEVTAIEIAQSVRKIK